MHTAKNSWTSKLQSNETKKLELSFMLEAKISLCWPTESGHSKRLI